MNTFKSLLARFPRMLDSDKLTSCVVRSVTGARTGLQRERGKMGQGVGSFNGKR